MDLRARLLASSLALAFVAFSAPVGADDKDLQYSIGGGAIVPLGDSGNRLATGWNLSASVGYPASELLTVRAAYQYAEFDLESGRDARHKLQVASFDLLLAPPAGHGVRPYVLAGPALVVRETDVAPPDGAAQRSVTDFGFGVGGGLDFRLGDSARLFVETRFTQVFGHGSEAALRGDARYLPLVVGLRF